MMLLTNSQYLPSEEIRFSNYPEVYQVTDRLNQLQELIFPVMAAVNDYSQGTEAYIYLNVSDTQKALDLSYDITDILGVASNVCYELLLPLRDLQMSLQELLFSYTYEKSPKVLDSQKTTLAQLTDATTS